MTHRHWRTRLILAGLGSLTVVLVTVTAVSAFVLLQLGRIERPELHDVLTPAPQEPVTAADVLLGDPAVSRDNDGPQSTSGDDGDVSAVDADDVDIAAVASPDDADDVELAAPGQRVEPRGSTGENYLLVGTDSTEGLALNDPLRSGHSDFSRLADVIMVVRLRDDGTTALMSIPRDLAVEIAGTGDIPGTGIVAKVNSAYNRDSTPEARAARLIDTIEENLDITLQHFVESDFLGFVRLVDAIGGVSMTFNRPMRDAVTTNENGRQSSRSGFVAEAGTQVLDGRQALAFVRTRNMQDWVAGRGWKTLPGENDLARNDRQRTLMLAAAKQVGPELLGNPIKLLSVLDIAADHLATSNTLSIVSDGRRLAQRFNEFDFEIDAEEYELRVQDTHTPVRWSLELTPDPHNQRVLEVFRGIGWDDVVESRVSVRVTGAERERIAAELRELGFIAEIGGPMPDGFESTALGTQTTVLFGSDGRLAAGLLASHLVPVPEFAGHDELATNTVILHVGDEPPLVDAGYRTVEIPAPELLGR